jgi:hypothetical protein
MGLDKPTVNVNNIACFLADSAPPASPSLSAKNVLKSTLIQLVNTAQLKNVWRHKHNF